MAEEPIIESQETPPAEKQLTDKELAEYNAKMKTWYDVQIPMLKKQKEYEALVADIEESRAKAVTMRMRVAQLLAPPPEPPSPEEQAAMRKTMEEASSKEQGPRKLKPQG